MCFNPLRSLRKLHCRSPLISFSQMRFLTSSFFKIRSCLGHWQWVKKKFDIGSDFAELFEYKVKKTDSPGRFRKIRITLRNLKIYFLLFSPQRIFINSAPYVQCTNNIFLMMKIKCNCLCCRKPRHMATELWLFYINQSD